MAPRRTIPPGAADPPRSSPSLSPPLLILLLLLLPPPGASMRSAAAHPVAYAFPTSRSSRRPSRRPLRPPTPPPVATRSSLLLLQTRPTTTTTTPRRRGGSVSCPGSPLPLPSLRSSFYDDFENFDDDDDDGDDDEDDDDAKLTNADLAGLRSRMGDLMEDGEDEDDEDEYADLEVGSPAASAAGGGEFSSIDDLISFATGGGGSGASDPPTEWAEAVEFDRGGDGGGDYYDMPSLRGGCVLLANPSKFCSDFDDPDDGDDNGGRRRRGGVGGLGPLSAVGNPFLGSSSSSSSAQPSPALLAKFGLTLPPPADLGPDRRADLLPVLVLLERHPLRGCQAVLMNRRTGYLLGDLEQQRDQDDYSGGPQSSSSSGPPPPAPRLGAFMIQPLWFGGTSAGGNGPEGGGGGGGASSPGGGGGGGGGGGSGLDMLHLCPTVPGSTRLTDDGLYWGGDPETAQDAMSDPGLDRVITGFDFKFFVQSTRWLPLQLEKEIRDGTWYVARVSKEVLFKSRDRLGTKRAKPLWTEVMELMGGRYRRVRDRLYEDE